MIVFFSFVIVAEKRQDQNTKRRKLDLHYQYLYWSSGPASLAGPTLEKATRDVPIWTNSRPIPFTLPASGIFISGRDWYSARCGNVGFMFGPNYSVDPFIG